MIWYAFEQNENLKSVNMRVRHHDETAERRSFDCCSFTDTSFRFTTGHDPKGCNLSDENIPFVFYKTDQCGAHKKN